jgi:Mrp family chromosome partitioning ATPase
MTEAHPSEDNSSGANPGLEPDGHEEVIRQALATLYHPELPDRNLVELGMIPSVRVEGERIRIQLALPYPNVPIKDTLIDMVRKCVSDLDPGLSVELETIEMTPKERAMFTERVRGQEPTHRGGRLVRQVTAVMSGKGGVGKSTVAGLLACALSRRQGRVGILDADITGPSIPRLFGLNQPPTSGPDGILPPETATGIKLISINLLLPDEDQPVVWRGPLIGRTIEQFWNDLDWGVLDDLIVDLPPGTADAALTVMQSLPVDGIVLVTSPQDLAGMVVRKAANMAKHLGIPLVGLIENFGHVICPECGARIEAFGPSRAAETAGLADVPLLGRLPLDPRLAILCDTGKIEEYRNPDFEAILSAILESAGATGGAPTKAPMSS